MTEKTIHVTLIIDGYVYQIAYLKNYQANKNLICDN